MNIDIEVYGIFACYIRYRSELVADVVTDWSRWGNNAIATDTLIVFHDFRISVG